MTLEQLSDEEQKVLACVKSGSAFFLLQLLAKEDDEVMRIIKGRKFGLGLHVSGGLKRSLAASDGVINIIEDSTAKTGIVFRFSDYLNLNLLLSSGKSKMFPVIKSAKAFSIINDFKKLTKRIPLYMNPEDNFLNENFRFITHLLMCAALRGIKEVAENDSYTETRVATIPDGLISVKVEGDAGLEALIEKNNRGFSVYSCSDGRTPNAVLSFSSVETAHRLFTGKLNAVEALGTSEIKIRGRIPMIQGLFPIMDRLSFYMSI